MKDIKYSITIPAQDGDGNEISDDDLREISNEIFARFGNVAQEFGDFDFTPFKATRHASTPETEREDDIWMNDLVKNVVAKLGLHEIPAVVKETFPS